MSFARVSRPRISAIHACQSTRVGEGHHPAAQGIVARVREVALGPSDQLVEPLIGIGFNLAYWHTLTPEARRGEGDQEALRRRDAGSEIGQAAVDELAAREPEGLEVARSEALPNPPSRRRSPGRGTAGLGGHPGGAGFPATSAVATKLVQNLGRELHD
jgi:hypothetical protein